MSKSILDFKGVIPAVISVFDQNEELDEGSTREFIRYLLSFNIGGLYLTGSTGEAFLMNSEERMRQVEIVMDECRGQVPVVVHVGAMSTRESIRLAEQAEKAGAAGISSVPPFYFKYSEDQIFGYYRDIAASVSLPLIVYNIPLAGMMTVDMIRRLSEIENVQGVKYTGTALYEVSRIRQSCKPGFQIYGGVDEMASSNIALGVDGIIGSFYNCLQDLYIRIWDAVKSGNQTLASDLQGKALRVIQLAFDSGSMIACIKMWLRNAGIPAGYSRKPFTNFSPEEEEDSVQKLCALDQTEAIALDIVKRMKTRL